MDLILNIVSICFTVCSVIIFMKIAGITPKSVVKNFLAGLKARRIVRKAFRRGKLTATERVRLTRGLDKRKRKD